jgi:hypothetical protein
MTIMNQFFHYIILFYLKRFEVGKLSDQSIENLIFELEKVSHDQNEGTFHSSLKKLNDNSKM